MSDNQLAEARADLAVWKSALRAIAIGQEYEIGSRRVTRADLPEVRKLVQYYQNLVNRLSSGRRAGARVQRIIPYDR